MLTRRWHPRDAAADPRRSGTNARSRPARNIIFGAICPARGVGAGLVLPRCNTQAMQWHLDEISALVTPGAHAVLIIDRAGWHTTGRLEIPSNITLMFLPPRAPELMDRPSQNIWQFMRDNWLSNRIFKTYDDIVALCCEAWNRLIDQPLEDHVDRPGAENGPWVLISSCLLVLVVPVYRRRAIVKSCVWEIMRRRDPGVLHLRI